MPFNFVIDLLKKPVSERLECDNETICKWLIQNFKIFSKISKETVEDIVNNLRFSECEENSLIIKQGDLGSSFFLIVDGQVSVYINTDPIDDQLSSNINNNKNFTKETNETFNKVTDKSKFGNFIRFIDSGYGFGEMALLNDDVRSATIISEKHCFLLILDKSIYNRSLRQHQEVEYKAFISFVNNSPIFNNWTPRYKKQVAMSLKRIIFPFEHEIIKQGDRINGIGFIIEGQAKVIMDISLHCQQYPQFDLPDRLLKSENSDGICSSLVKSLGKVKNIKHLEISLVGRGEIIGDIEQVKGLSTSFKTLLPIESTEVYFLNDKNVERLITSKRNQTAVDNLRKLVDQKLLCQFARPIYRQIPLMTHIVSVIINEAFSTKQHYLYPQTKKSSNTISNNLIYRGPLIDTYSPGTVFNHNRQLKQKRKNNQSVQRTINSTSISKKNENVSEILPSIAVERNPVFLDWETNSIKLDKLETKILSWYETDNQNKDNKIIIPKLQRFIKKEIDFVKPGKTNLLKPKKAFTLLDLMLNVRINPDQQKN